MPERRVVNCPRCGVERTTKAGRGTRLACRSCGHQYRAPAPGEATATASAPPVAPVAVGTAATGVSVVKATAARVAMPPAVVLDDTSAPATGDVSPSSTNRHPSTVDPDDDTAPAPVVELDDKRRSRPKSTRPGVNRYQRARGR